MPRRHKVMVPEIQPADDEEDEEDTPTPSQSGTPGSCADDWACDRTLQVSTAGGV